jgi:hypothetical protein
MKMKMNTMNMTRILNIDFWKEHNDDLVGLLVILIAIWIVLYFLPQVIVSLINTLLGNFILLLSVLLIYSANPIHGVIAIFIVAVLYQIVRLSHRKESFTPQSELDFLRIQHTINKQKVFDMRVIDTQASQEELDYFNQHGIWPWSPEVIELYEEAIRNNPYIRTVEQDATMEARKTYNQAAIIRILTYQSKEGQFLLNGVEVENNQNVLPSGFGDFPYEAELFDHPTGDIIQCNLSKNTPTLERVNYSGHGLLESQSKEVTPVDYHELEQLVPGFTFLKGACNPCSSMASTPDYSCTYRLKKDEAPSSIWEYLWSSKS